MRQDAVAIPTVASRRYVVSMFGTISDWVHNLEVANGDAVISRATRRLNVINFAGPVLRALAAARTFGVRGQVEF